MKNVTCIFAVLACICLAVVPAGVAGPTPTLDLNVTTMSYTPDNLLLNRLTAERLAELTDDAHPATVQWDVVDQARVEADELVDGYCRGRYVVPFADPVPGIIQSCAADIVIFKLYERRLGLDMPDTVVRQRDNALKMLASIQRGQLQLGVAMPEEPGQAHIVSNARPEDRQFPRDVLNRMP